MRRPDIEALESEAGEHDPEEDDAEEESLNGENYLERCSKAGCKAIVFVLTISVSITIDSDFRLTILDYDLQP